MAEQRQNRNNYTNTYRLIRLVYTLCDRIWRNGMNNGSEINRKIIINYTTATAESRMFPMRCMCHGLWKQITSSFSSFFLHSLSLYLLHSIFFTFTGSVCLCFVSFHSRNAPLPPALQFIFLFFNFRIQFGCAWFAIYGNSYRAHNELFNPVYRLWICKLRGAYAIRRESSAKKNAHTTKQHWNGKAGENKSKAYCVIPSCVDCGSCLWI